MTGNEAKVAEPTGGASPKYRVRSGAKGPSSDGTGWWGDYCEMARERDEGWRGQGPKKRRSEKSVWSP